MERASLAVFRSSADRCVNGCCELRHMQSGCSMSWRDSIGPKESNYSSETGSAKAKAQRSISRSTKATKKSAFLRRVLTHFTAEHSSCSRRNIRNSIYQLWLLFNQREMNRQLDSRA